MDLGQEEVTLAVTVVKDGPGREVGSEEEEEDSPVEEDSREENLTKAPPPRGPEYLVNLKTKTKIDAIIAISEDTAAECPEKNKGQSQKSSEGKKFEDYTYAYGGAEEPQLAMATAFPQAYEEALSAMRQSLKNQDPLHGLNM